MMDSEKKELRKRKTKRIVIWTVGITAIAVLVTVLIISGFLGGGSS